MIFRKKLAGVTVSLVLTLSALLTLGTATPVYATEELNISVYVNGDRIDFDEPPRLEDDRTLVPMRAIFEAFGAIVTWEEESETASARLGDTNISLTIDDNIMQKNDEEIELDVPAKVYGERTLVPVRAISEAFGSFVDWDQNTKTVFVDENINPLQGTMINDDYRYDRYHGEFNFVNIFDKNDSEYFGMELLEITDDQGENYAETINLYKAAVPNANVYNIVVPTAAEFYAKDEYKTSYTPSIRKIYSKLDDSVKGINIIANLMSHADENIYFHTDHHWTQLGAFYAYEAFINELGDDIDPYYTFDTQNIYNYYGSLARMTVNTPGYEMLQKTPDLLQLFSPKVSYTGKSYNDMYMKDYIKDMRALKPDFKNYNCFIEGDFPVEVFNTSVKNGRSLAIVKESYGNAFAVWALNNFETVYVVDYRKFNNYGGTGEYLNEFSISKFQSITSFTDLLIISYPVSVTNTPEATALRAMAK